MRKVDRSILSSAPKALTEKYGRDKLSELERVIAHRKVEDEKALNDPKYKKKSFSYSRYKHQDVKNALAELFFGKCAYCETFYERSHPVDVEHYRPKNGVDGHEGGYWWLGMDWDNLLPSCIDCNRKREQKVAPAASTLLKNIQNGLDFDHWASRKSGKATAFPLLDESKRILDYDRAAEVLNERPLLIDPCRDNPADYISFLVDDISTLLESQAEDDEVAANAIDADLFVTQINSEQHRHKLPLISLVLPASIHSDEEDFEASKIAESSILIYGLNRLGLVQARTKVLRDLEFLLEMSIGLQSISDELSVRQEKQKAYLRDTKRLRISTREMMAENLEMDSKIISKLDHMKSRILDEIKRRTAPSAEYSMLAQSWLRKITSSELQT